MPILSNCPKCEQPVTVPDGVDPSGQVRCPLCDAEYPLSEAMASSLSLDEVLDIVGEAALKEAEQQTAAAKAEEARLNATEVQAALADRDVAR